MVSLRQQAKQRSKFYFIATGAFALIAGAIWCHQQAQPFLAVSSTSAAAASSSDSVPRQHPHEIRLSGLQTPEMHEKMMSSCPADLRLETNPTMTLPEFVDKVFDGLEQVEVPEDPLLHVAQKYSHFMENRGALGTGFWAEFGVWNGGTLIKAYDRLEKTRFTGPIAGFDSFEGLPETWRGNFKEGRFATDYDSVREKVPDKIALYKGWFQDTIGTFLFDNPDTPAGFINHDGDLFLSTAITFSLLNNRIVPGTLMCFDELIGYPGFQKHEILSLFIWMREMEATLCPIAVYKLNRTVASDFDMKKEVGQGSQGACYQVLEIPGKRVPI